LLLLIFAHKKQEKEIRTIISLFKKSQFKNEQNFENENIYLDTYETDIYKKKKKNY